MDDFHFLDPVLQKEVVRVLKSEVFDGLSTILIAVPHRAFDAINVEREMEGRFSHVSIPSWEIDDLIRIGEIGFPELGMIVSVTSRQVVWLFLEQLWFEFVPFLHRLQGRLAAQG